MYLFGQDNCGINKPDLQFFEELFESTKKHKNIVELGTWLGFTAMYFGIVTSLRDGWCITFDIRDNRFKKIIPLWTPNITFIEVDLLHIPPQNIVKDAIGRENCIIFVDNGSKLRELQTLTPYIHKENLVVIHDVDVQFPESEILSVNGWVMNVERANRAKEIGSACRLLTYGG